MFGWSSLHRCNARTPLCSATPVHYSLGARPLQRLVSPRSPCLVLSRSDARHSHFGRSGIRSAELCRSGARPIKDSSASPLRQPLSCPGTLTLVTPVPAISGARIIWRSAAPPLGYSGASLSTAVPVIVRLCNWVLSGALPLWCPLLPSAQPLQCLFPPAVGRSSDRGPKSALTETRRFLFTFTHLLLLLFVSSSLLLSLVLLALHLLFYSASTLLGGNTHLACKIHTQTQEQTKQRNNCVKQPATR